jgi:6-phosphogluconolactonase
VSRTVQIFENEDDLAVHAADFIAHTLSDAVAARGRATLSLSGGTAPRKTYALLAQPALRDRIDWARTCVFFGDERFVPADDKESNLALARHLMLDALRIPSENIFPVNTRLGNADSAANVYAATIEQAFGLHEGDGPPRFDLMLMGLGPDGHLAALFPGAASLSVEDRWVVASPPGILPPAVERITMTLPVFNASRIVLALVSGAAKAPILHEVLEGGRKRDECPAAGVAPANGELHWFVDRAAAGQLYRSHS